jgi:UDP-glucose 4-epimerase
MKAAIIGAAGFLGRALASHLRQKGWQVHRYDVVRPPDGTGLHFEILDVLHQPSVFPEGTQAVFYLAQSARYREFPEGADHLFGVNTYGPVRAAGAAVAAGAAFFCFTSTGNVYRPSLEPLREDHPLRRDDPYALSKVAAEEILRLFSGTMRVCSARLFGLFGPGQEKMLPVTLLECIRTGREIFLEPAPGDTGDPGGLEVSFSYVEDTARILGLLAETALEGREVPAAVNVAGPEPVSVRRFAGAIARRLGIEPRFSCAPTVRGLNLIADIGLLRSLLAPEFTSFDEAIERTYGSPPVRGSKPS